MTSHRYYKFAVVISLVAVLFLAWLALGVGINGPDGDAFDRIYLWVFGIGVLGIFISRLKPAGLSWTLLAMGIAQILVAVLAIAQGKHLTESSPALEIILLNGFFAAAFFVAAKLFKKAAQTS